MKKDQNLPAKLIALGSASKAQSNNALPVLVAVSIIKSSAAHALIWIQGLTGCELA
jgi:hypothetical protein